MIKKLISIVTPTYNEIDNIDELYLRLKKVINATGKYNFEIICIDNNSSDGTIDKLRKIASKDKSFKVILNEKNFGHLKSPYHAILNTNSDATIFISSDLQDPPENIPEFIKKWENGSRVVLAVKNISDESKLLFFIRSFYYAFLNYISDSKTIRNATGAGLIDRKIVNILNNIDDRNPYFRGLVCEITDSIDTVEFHQPNRQRGITKNNFFTLFDLAMLGITNHSRFPLRIMTIGGFIISFVSLVIAVFYTLLKVFYWGSYEFGTVPVLIGVFFFGALQAFCIGVLGEYIGTIHARSRNFPLVIERERINFD